MEEKGYNLDQRLKETQMNECIFKKICLDYHNGKCEHLKNDYTQCSSWNIYIEMKSIGYYKEL